MQLEIIGKKGQTLKHHVYNGTTYVEAPQTGEYKIRVRNTSGARRLAIVSVDGVNVLDGKDAGFDGQGYVLRAWETIDIPGWRRSDNTVAKFEFKEQGDSYAAQTGRGTTNVGVIGVAVYDEKVQTYVPVVWPVAPVTPTWPQPYTWSLLSDSVSETQTGDSLMYYEQSMSAACNTKGIEDIPRGRPLRYRMRSPIREEQTYGGVFACNAIQDVGTGYGHEASFHTVTTSFTRATISPALVLSLHYATRERLKSWGIPVDDPAPTKAMAPNPFPVSQPSVPAPPGWRG